MLYIARAKEEGNAATEMGKKQSREARRGLQTLAGAPSGKTEGRHLPLEASKPEEMERLPTCLASQESRTGSAGNAEALAQDQKQSDQVREASCCPQKVVSKAS